MKSTRPERDTFGIIQVPDIRLWGAQTQRSLEYFSISTECMPVEMILALAKVKGSCARVNADLGILDIDKADSIISAVEEVLSGLHGEEFPLSVWQAGSGTHTNMNMNEVLANRASEILGGERGLSRCIHPNDHVNLGQSSNDVFPTAMHVSAAVAVISNLLPSLFRLRNTFLALTREFSDILKVGRTHLQDAVPLTLGQEFSGYVAQLDHAEIVLRKALPSLYPLAIGGTAVGTGLNTHAEFGSRVTADLRQFFGLPFVSADNKFSLLAAHDGLVVVHGAIKALSVALMKISNDIRWLASGPHAGLGEINLPENEPGSSIMPGKVNPTQCEALTMACCQVMGNDVAITAGGALGSFELNAYKPLIIFNFLQSVRLMANGMDSFEINCIRGITVNRDRIRQFLDQSLMLVTLLTPHIGYDRAAEVVQRAQSENLTLRQSALATGYVTEMQYFSWIDDFLF